MATVAQILLMGYQLAATNKCHFHSRPYFYNFSFLFLECHEFYFTYVVLFYHTNYNMQLTLVLQHDLALLDYTSNQTRQKCEKATTP